MTATHSNRIIGFVYLILSAALYGTMPIICKFMYQTGLSPVSTLIMRYGFSGILLVIYLGLLKRQSFFSRSPLIIIQGILFVGASLLYFYAVKYLPAGLVVTIIYVYPALVAMLAVFIYKERLTIWQVIALLMALVGIVIISGLLGEKAHRLSTPGIIMVIGASLCYSFYVIIGQKSTNQAPAITMVATHTLVALIMLIIFYPHEVILVSQSSLYQLLLGLTMAILNTILTMFFFLRGLSIIGASRAALVSTAEPAFTLLFAFIFLGEIISPLQGVGVILILASTFLALGKKAV